MGAGSLLGLRRTGFVPTGFVLSVARGSFFSIDRRAWSSEPMEIVPGIFCSPLGSLDSALTTYFTSAGLLKQRLAVSLDPRLAVYWLRSAPMIPPKFR